MKHRFIRWIASILNRLGYETRRIQRPRAAVDAVKAATTEQLRREVAARRVA